jgi:hypothetical protein
VVTIPDRPLLPLGLTVIKVSNDNGGIYSTGSDFFIGIFIVIVIVIV